MINIFGTRVKFKVLKKDKWKIGILYKDSEYTGGYKIVSASERNGDSGIYGISVVYEFERI